MVVRKKEILKILIVLIVVMLGMIPNQKAISSQSDFFNMSYIFFGNPSTYSQQVNNTRGSLQQVSPNYFDLTKEGDLKFTWKLQNQFITEMHSKGIKVVPFLSNHWDLNTGINGLNK